MLRIKRLLAAPLLAAALANASAEGTHVDVDDEAGLWRVVVDGVMGGRSTGSVRRIESGVLRFSGVLSLENNGGFSQIRSDVPRGRFAEAQGIEITVRGDGRDYTFDVRCADARVMAGGFQRVFGTRDGEWTTIRLPFDRFDLYSFGRRVPGASALTPALIESIGFTLSDKKAGPFRLDIASIRTIGDGPLPARAAAAGLDGWPRRSPLERLRGLLGTDVVEEEAVRVAPNAAGDATRLIELAISRGVPLFNNGQPAACAAVYEVAIEAMVQLGAEVLGRALVTRLEQGLAAAKLDRSASDRAWTYRRALDDAYGHLARQPNLDRGIAAR